MNRWASSFAWSQVMAFAACAMFSTWSQGETRADARECGDAPWLSAAALKKVDVGLSVFRRYCYGDKSGSYMLVLAEKQDRQFDEELLSTAIQASLYKVGRDHSLTRQWAIRDFPRAEEAGVNFRSKFVDLADVDGDGLIEPILVYRFFQTKGAQRKLDTSAYSGRLKLIMFHRGEKTTIEAVTGTLDSDRKTTGNANYFSLPGSARQYLVRKIAGIDAGEFFAFANGHPGGFTPQRERRAR